MSIEIGQPAPDFELPNQNGEPVRLSSFRGQKNVVLVFYPFAFSGICSGELCEIRDRIANFNNAETVTLGVSCDSKFAQRIFAERDGYTFDLLSDFWPHGAVGAAYGVFDEEKGASRRGTFIIDTDGIVRWSIVNAIPDARDIAAYEKALAEL